jgi:outer membrane receptor for ferrienterochelin and colicin
MDEVVVSATRMNLSLRSIPQKVEILNEKEINSLPSQDLSDVLKKRTNLDLVQYPGISATIGMRGFSPSAHSRSYTLILINGKPAGTTNLASIGTDNISRVEIIKGPYSVLYGSDAMGGVINIITKSGQDEVSGHVSVSAGSFGQRQYKASFSGGIKENSTFTAGFSRIEQTKDYTMGTRNLLPITDVQHLILDEASYGDVMQNSKYTIHHANGKVSHRLGEHWNLEGEAIYTFAKKVGVPGNYWGSYGQTIKDINRLGTYASAVGSYQKHTISISPYFTVENNPNYNNNSDTGFVNFISHVKEYGVKVQDHIDLGSFQVLLGADVDAYDYSSERFSDRAVSTSPYSPDHINVKNALLSQVIYSHKGLVLNAGGRLNHIRYHIEANEMLEGTGGKEIYNHFNPSAGILYTTPFHLKFHGSYGTAFSVPDAFKVAGHYSVSEYFAAWDFWWIKNYAGNPDLKPESSATYDLGLGYQSDNKLISADLTYFNTRHKDKIVEYVYNDTTSYMNANSSLMKGVEVLLSTNLGTLFDNRFRLELYGNFTHMINSSVEESLSDMSGGDSLVVRDMLYTRADHGNFGIVFDNYSGFSSRLHARYMGSRLERDNFSTLRPGITVGDYYSEGGWTQTDQILEHPTHLIFDFSISYTLKKHYKLGVTVSNVLDENYSEKDGYNMPGRMFTGSVTISF